MMIIMGKVDLFMLANMTSSEQRGIQHSFETVHAFVYGVNGGE